MSEAVLRPLIWLDYRLALIFLVVLPLGLMLWAVMQRMEAIQRLMAIYWKVSSLLAITVYLMIAALPIGFLTGPLALGLIVVGLWFWVDINEDIADMATWRPLRVAFNAWRWAVTLYGSVAGLLGLLFIRCAVTAKDKMLADGTCPIWLEAPWGYKQMFHANTGAGFLGFLGIVGLIVYVLVLAYFVMVKLARTGRSAAGG
jgi:hypothetical protein